MTKGSRRGYQNYKWHNMDIIDWILDYTQIMACIMVSVLNVLQLIRCSSWNCITSTVQLLQIVSVHPGCTLDSKAMTQT